MFKNGSICFYLLAECEFSVSVEERRIRPGVARTWLGSLAWR
jgi:hypothetical protein